MSSIVIPSSVWPGHLWKMLEPTLRTLRDPVKNWAADSMLNRAGRVLPQELDDGWPESVEEQVTRVRYKYKHYEKD